MHLKQQNEDLKKLSENNKLIYHILNVSEYYCWECPYRFQVRDVIYFCKIVMLSCKIDTLSFFLKFNYVYWRFGNENHNNIENDCVLQKYNISIWFILSFSCHTFIQVKLVKPHNKNINNKKKKTNYANYLYVSLKSKHIFGENIPQWPN